MNKQINKRFWEEQVFEGFKYDQDIRDEFYKILLAIELSTYDRVIEVLEKKKKELESNDNGDFGSHESYASDCLDSVIEQIKTLKQ